MDFVTGYVDRLRTRAQERRREGLEQAAHQYELVAGELEAEHHAWLNETLTPQQAAEESGFTAHHVKYLLRTQAIPNAGEAGKPRVRRADLPKKPGHATSPVALTGPARSGGARAATPARASRGSARGEPDVVALALGTGGSSGARARRGGRT